MVKLAKIARLKDMISLRRAIILKIISRGTTQIASKGCPSGSIKPYAFTQQYGKVLLGNRAKALKSESDFEWRIFRSDFVKILANTAQYWLRFCLAYRKIRSFKILRPFRPIRIPMLWLPFLPFGSEATNIKVFPTGSHQPPALFFGKVGLIPSSSLPFIDNKGIISHLQ